MCKMDDHKHQLQQHAPQSHHLQALQTLERCLDFDPSENDSRCFIQDLSGVFLHRVPFAWLPIYTCHL
jgi:hypothetical protein